LRKKRTIGGETFKLKPPTEEISKQMSKIRSSNTSIEQIFDLGLKMAKLNYRDQKFLIKNIIGRPDFILPKYKIAIFCDGDFWHGRNSRIKIKKNPKFWQAKINRNMERDKEVNEILEESGWKVLRFWETDIKKDLQSCIDKVIEQTSAQNKVYHFRYVDLFSGIGGFRIALDNVGGKCLGFSEINKRSIQVYKKNFSDILDPDVDLGDITKITKLPFEDIDLIVGGVPCQAWSIAGKNKAFEDTRGKLWEDAIRVVKLNQPKAFIFENVKGLIDPRNSQNLTLIISTLESAGYIVKKPRLLNSYDFGLPQNRDRIFIVGFRKDLKDQAAQFEYPKSINFSLSLADVIDGLKKNSIQKKSFSALDIFGNKVPFGLNRFQSQNHLNDFFVFSDIRNGHSTIHSWEIIKTSEREKSICLTILKNRRKKLYGDKDGNPISFKNLKLLIKDLKEGELKGLVEKNILRTTTGGKYEFVNSKLSAGINGIYRIYLPSSVIFSTLTATGTKDYIATKYLDLKNPKKYKEQFINEIFNKGHYRQISAKEAGRLQGFPDHFVFDENENEANKQFGNAVATNVVYFLAKKVLESLNILEPNKIALR
jgi:DNA (cytosine-5)-methyltransferase 1